MRFASFTMILSLAVNPPLLADKTEHGARRTFAPNSHAGEKSPA